MLPDDELRALADDLCQCGCGSVEGVTCKMQQQAGIDHGIYWPRDNMTLRHTFTAEEVQHIKDFKKAR
jgi:hypothetical protein